MRGVDTGRQGLHIRSNAAERLTLAAPEPLDAVLKRLVKSRRFRDAFKHREVFQEWPKAAGEAVAKQTRAVGIKEGRLTIECSSHALASELSAFAKPELVERLAEGLGSGVVVDIKFVVGENFGEK